MNAVAIRTDSLGKRYRLGARQAPYRTLRESLVEAAKAPFRRIARLGRGAPEVETIWALREVSLEVRRGEVVGVIGRNGARKSTLLKILSRVTEPTEGRAEIRGRMGSLLEVGTGFHPELTGRENIYLSGAILGLRRAEIARRLDEIVAFAEIERFLDTPVKRYSSGMQVRLGFAVAAHLEADVLLVDEVLAVGDAAFQRKCLGKMGDVTQEGRTALFVSHNMAAVRALCGRTAWLDGGKIVDVGETAAVVNGYVERALLSAKSGLDLGRLQRGADHGRALRIRSVSFNGGEEILYGKPLRARIEFETREKKQAVSFGIGFCTPEGVRLATVSSDIPGPRRDLPAGAHGWAEVSIDRFDLQPGMYLVDLGARSGDETTLDHLSACVRIQVLPTPETPIVATRGAGGVRVPCECNWEVPQ